jgi:hypothetical protein
MHRTTYPLAAFLILATLPCRGGDFEIEPFTLRYTAALSRISTYPDVAGQAGASVASLRSTSVNPAALAWYALLDEKGNPLRFALSAQYTGLYFNRGTDIWANTQSLNFYWTKNFAMKFAVTELRSNEERARNGAIFETDTNAYRLDLSWRFDHAEHPSSVGLQLNYSQSETNFSRPAGVYPSLPFGAPREFEKQIAGDADRESFGARLGWQISLLPPERATTAGDGKSMRGGPATTTSRYDRWLAGVSLDYVYQPTKVGDYTSRLAGAVSSPGVIDRQDFNQVLTRVGTAFRYTPESWAVADRVGYVRLDYQWGWFAGEASELQVHRLYVGGNFPLHAAFDVNAGFVVDDRRNAAWAAGLGFHTHTFAVDVAYQHDMLPEIATDFGNAGNLVVSAGFAF